MSNAKEILTSKGKFRIELGLNRVKKMLELFSNPQNDVQFIHVAGTNGKGSTSAIIESILLEYKEKKIGKFTSPHLFSYTERFSINGKNITEEELDELVELVNSKDKEFELGLTEFEVLTVVCFLYFKKHKVDIGILEVGLGGRLDATNVIENPIVSVITSISLEHTERLGDTIEKIAKEKAGIIKKGSFCVFSKNNQGFKTLLSNAISKNAKIVEDNISLDVKNKIAVIEGKEVPFNLAGDFQKENLKLALLAIKCLPFSVNFETVKRGLKNARWKFRMEETSLNGKRLLIDGAHNPDGARVLADYLKTYHKKDKIKFIFGCLKNKDYNSILKILNSVNIEEFCFYEFDYPNALKYSDLGQFKEIMIEIENPIEEIKKGGFDLFVIAGSLYMLGKIFNKIKLD